MKKINGERGQTLIFVALGMTMLLGFVGFATDVGVLLHVKREAQTAADAAAVAAATEALAEANPATLSTGEYNAAYSDASSNGFTGGSSSGTVNSSNGTTLTINLPPNITVPTFNTAGYVQATISQTAPTIFIKAFMGLFGNSGYSGMTVGATAIASDTITSNGCVNVTDNGGANPSVSMGGHSLIASPHCNVSITGNLDMSGSAAMQAGSVTITGSITGNNPSGPYAVGVPPQPIPAFLTALNQTANQPTLTTTNGVTTCAAPPATGMACVYDYNGGVLTGTLASGASGTVYYFDEPGGPTFTSPISETGAGITIYLAPTTLTGTAINPPFSFIDGGNGNLTLSAPTCTLPSTNPYCQVLLDAPTDGQTGGTYTCSSGKGNNSGNPAELYFGFGSDVTTLTGIVYAPSMQLFAQDNGAKNKGGTSINTDLVIGNICEQSSPLTVNGLSSDSPITKVGLVY